MRALALLPLAVLFVPLGDAVVGPAYESFEEGWGAWALDDDVWCLHEAEQCEWNRDADRALGPAFDGAWGVLIRQDGLHDSGAIWVERQIPVPGGERVEVAFWVFSALLAPTTAWEARAYAGLEDPESEFDLVGVGAVDEVPGWQRYCLAVLAPAAETMWVAAGVRASWESGTRFHALDYVSVRGATGGEPCGLLEDPCHVAAAPCTAQRASCDVAVCPQG